MSYIDNDNILHLHYLLSDDRYIMIGWLIER